MIAAVEKRDFDGLMLLVDDRALVDFGGGEGKDAFRSAWELGSAGQSKVWDELKEALSLGCALRESVAVAPSFPSQLDPDADMFESALAVHPGALVRDKDGKALGKLDWEVVTVIELPEQGDARIKLADGREAYVAPGDLRSAADYRLTMERKSGAWKITAFVAGD
ncbi:hypothetical protein GCM10023264_01750 [Sphingomonas daechungensis]